MFPKFHAIAYEALSILGPHVVNLFFGEVVVFVGRLAAEDKAKVT